MAATFTGPYLVTKVLSSTNVVIQRSRRANPIVTHIDKLKVCSGEHPDSWLDREVPDPEPVVQSTLPDTPVFPPAVKRRRKCGPPQADVPVEPEAVPRPTRQRQVPRRFFD